MEQLQPLHSFDWYVIGAFFGVSIAIGLYFSRKGTVSLSDYFVAGRKMTWWIAGTSIVATTFASDTPLVISGWCRTSGIEKNWFWWGGLMGTMLCTFFFARLWRRSGVLTDIEFNELRYSGKRAAGLRLFHAGYGALVKNTIIMGWVTLAMSKILEVTLDIPTLIFLKGQWLPTLVPKGVNPVSVLDWASVAQFPLIGDAVIPAKVTGILLCFGVAVFYSAIAGLWGVLATDFFQFIFAMVGSIIFMVVLLVHCGGPSGMVTKAQSAVREGRVFNKAPRPRDQIERAALEKALHKQSLRTVMDVGLLTDEEGETALRWTDDSLSEQDVRSRIERLPLPVQNVVLDLWKSSFTISRASFPDSTEIEKLIQAGLLTEARSPKGVREDYYLLSSVSTSEKELLARLDAAGVMDKGGFMAAWRKDQTVPARNISSFLPPFDLKGGGLLALWSFIVFVGLQWWGGGQGGSFLSQRLFACKDEKHSVLAMLWYNLAHYALRPWPWIVAGIASLWLIPDITAYGAHYDQEYAYVVMFMKYLPVGLKGLMVASLMAAYMSTISTQVNLGASYFINDLYRRFIHPTASERHNLVLSQLTTIVLALIAGIYAFYSSSIASGWFTILEMLSGAGLVLLVRWYWWRVNAWSEIAAMASSLGLYGVLNWTRLFHRLCSWFGAPQYWMDEYAVRFTLNLVISTVIWVVVTYLTAPEPETKLVDFYRRVRPAGFWKPVAERAGVVHPLMIGKAEYTAWALGSGGLICLVVGLGKVVLGQYLGAVFLIALGIVAAAGVMRLVSQMDWSDDKAE